MLVGLVPADVVAAPKKKVGKKTVAEEMKESKKKKKKSDKKSSKEDVESGIATLELDDDEYVVNTVDETSLVASLKKAKTYIDALTINNSSNDPETVVKGFKKHFTWDNEKRENSASYLFDWSYYNGVVFEGLEYVYEETEEEVYGDYVEEYMSSLIASNGTWAKCTNDSSKVCAGYNSTHGADCYKTASLLLDMYERTNDSRYLTMAKTLYADLDNAAKTYLLSKAGNNYRHTWASDPSPDLWLDGLYMILPFRAEYAKHIGDTEELDLIVDRMQWVSDNMYNKNKGLFYHAADSSTSNSGTHWLRSIGWYAAAIVDIMDSMEGENLEVMKAQLVKLVDGMKACQNASNGMWLNNMNAKQSSSNPYETSGTALVCYAVMKAVNEGWLDESYVDMAILAFEGICNEKLNGNNLTDICFKGAPGSSNSEFYDNEGKGVGPFIMFYAEMLEYVDEQDDEDSDTPVEPEKPEAPEVTVEDTTIKVENVTDLVGTVVTNEDKAVIEEKEYTNFVAYDITATLVDGIKAIVSIPVPAEWNATEDELVGISVEDGEVKEIEGTLSEDGIYSFEVDHFSAKGVAYNAKAVSEPTNSATGYLMGKREYTLDTNGVDYGSDNHYLIVSSGNNEYALTSNGSNTGIVAVDIINNKITLDTSDYDWYFDTGLTNTGSNTYNTFITQDGKTWLYHTNSNMYVGNGNDAHRGYWQVENRNNGNYRIGDQDGNVWRLYYNNNKFTVRSNVANNTHVRLFKLTNSTVGGPVTFTINPASVIMKPELTRELSGTVNVDGQVVELDKCNITWDSNNKNVATVNNGIVTSIANGNTIITATLSEVNGTSLQENIVLSIPVTVADKNIASATLEGNTPISTAQNTEPNFNNIKLKVIYDDGTTEEITVNEGLEITDYDISEIGSYYALISYQGRTYGTIRVDVTGANADGTAKSPYDGLEQTTDYPEYPNQGAVRMDKKATSEVGEFERTGVTHVELDVAGISTQKAVDVVLVVDVSNSMAWSLQNSGASSDADRVPSAGQQTKIEQTMASCKEFVEILMEPNKDGTKNDNSVTFVTFGGFDAQHENTNTEYFDSTNTWLVGSKDIDEITALFDSVSIVRDTTYNGQYKISIDGVTGGNFGNTVYDYGFAETIKAINSLQGSSYDTNKRETHVIFMTDGAPSNYNGGYYTSGRSENLKVDSNTQFENKGNNDKNTWYNYICSQEHTYARQVYDKVNGKFSTVGFDLVHGGFGDKQWSEADLTAFLEKIVRDENNNGLNPVVAATNEAQLAQFYREAANAIKAAGSQGRVTDIVDGDFTLQMATQTGLTTGEPQTLKNPPKITVTKYDLWTAKDTNDLALIGKRKVDDEGNPIKEVLETVTFNAAGTEAYSNRVENGTKNILSTANDGTVTIKAQTFTYKKDTEGVESFDWFIETISEKEVVLEFDAYLKGAMEGDAPKGTYYTNEEATLEYIDVNGKYVNRLFPVPVVNWGGATTTVRYYLVNHEGKPVNRAGQVVPDAARIYVGNPVTVPLNLNADLSINSSPIDAAANVPTGYFLYDENATFSVKTTSSTEGITGGIVVSEPSADAYKTTGTGENVKTQTGAQTTIVTDYEPGYYTYSTVIFGVRWDLTKEKISPLENDKIVLDYGKAIQEDVLANDVEELEQISSDRKATYNAQLVGFVKYNANTKLDEIMVSAGEATLEGKNGNFSIVDGKVQYQLTKMLSEVEKVFCVVKLTNTVNNDDYFYMYEELDIIPATSVYYENDFADFITYTDGGAKWGETNETAGRDNLQNDGTVGTNEAYGYDTSYDDDVKYSNGKAKVITTSTDPKVDGYNKTYATFTFTGTGFDLISTTSKESGMIRAEIYAGDTIEDGEKFIKYAQVANVGASTLYQIPVISYEGLEHGTYTVKLHVYNSYENTTTPELSRGGMFHFDALRIYDPINVEGTLTKGSDAEIAKAAYVVDEEAYNKHFEVREAIISAADFESTTEGTDGDGVVYIDASASSNIIANPEATVQDYEADGPNNETYLINDSAVIGFILEVDEIPESLQIGAKSVLGNDVMMDMYIENPEDPDVCAAMITPENGFNHASAQNYSVFVDGSDENEVIDFSPYFVEQEDGTYQTYVYISKVPADDETDNSILSITDFKATFAEESGMRATYNSGLVNAYNLRNTAEKDEVVTSDVELYSAAFTTTSVRYTKQAVLEVETSVSVEELVLVNEKGKVMTAATTVETSEDGNKVWTLKFKPGNVGVRTFTVYGVAEDGCETERATVSIEATKR